MSEIEFKYQINQYSGPSNLDTQKLFDKNYTHPNLSAIDLFLMKTQKLNTLISDPQKIPEQLTNLIILGYVSAVESYFREIIRKLILTDQETNKICAEKPLTFGAATSHTEEMLPEALLEHCQFISKSNILISLQNFLGIKGKIPSEVEETLSQFEKVCQLRHCIVHRFGHLGSHNAIQLGINEHKNYLEKPILIDFNNLQLIFLICNNMVKVINNYIFCNILSRTTKDNYKYWQWDYRKDKKMFEKYYKIFYCTISPPPNNPKSIEVYNVFRKTYIKANKIKKQ